MDPQSYWQQDGFCWKAVWRAGEVLGRFQVRLTNDDAGSLHSREWIIECIGEDGRQHYVDTLYGIKPDEHMYFVLTAANKVLFDSGLIWVMKGK